MIPVHHENNIMGERKVMLHSPIKCAGRFQYKSDGEENKQTINNSNQDFVKRGLFHLIVSL
jgi:hypothetical protein